MVSSGIDLLRQLAGGLIPDGTAPKQASAPVDATSFASLLADVGAGRVASGRPVEIGVHADIELTQGQLDRLAAVADAGEAAGATRLGVMIDGQVLTLDVLNRTVEGTSEGGSVLTGIDGFVVAPPGDGLGDAIEGLGAGARGLGDALGRGLGVIRNRSVAELLGTISGDGDASGVSDNG